MRMLQSYREWRGNAEELTFLMEGDFRELLLAHEIPSSRTIRYWRSENLIGQVRGRKFGYRQIFETLAVIHFKSAGLKLEAIRKKIEGLPLEKLEGLVSSQFSQESSISNLPREQSVVYLLASGVTKLYQKIRLGESIVQQDHELLPEDLQNALSHLGRLYIENQSEDRAASVHDVLARCRSPLKSWGIEAFTNTDFPFGDTVLIDDDLFLPTEECFSLATRSGVSNNLEHEAFDALNNCLLSTGRDANRLYTAVREYLGRRSLTRYSDLVAYCNEQDFPNSLLSLVVKDFYTVVPDAWLIKGVACECANCGTLLRSDYRPPGFRCPLIACRDRNPITKAGAELEPHQARIAKPHLLAYWVNPAIDELLVYDFAKELGLPAKLYPERDRCDVSIDDVGIDVKARRNPITLGKKLQQTIGGLQTYQKRIIAIPDGVLSRRNNYLVQLREELTGDAARTLNVMSVSKLLRYLQRIARA